MTVTITPAGDSACTLTETTCSSTAVFPIPLSAADLVALIRSILASSSAASNVSGVVRADRYRDGVKISVGSGTFGIRYHDACPLVLGA